MRMDPYTPQLRAGGVGGRIGKGKRSREVRAAMMARGAVYFVAVGGAAALLAERIRRAEVVAYADLGTEAIRLLEHEDFPAVVGNDVYGGDLFEAGREAYRSSVAVSPPGRAPGAGPGPRAGRGARRMRTLELQHVTQEVRRLVQSINVHTAEPTMARLVQIMEL